MNAPNPDLGHHAGGNPSDLLLAFALSVIVPLLMAGGIGDAEAARCAAMETIAAYRANGRDQLVSIAQLVGFALVSLDSLRLSVPAELSLPMKLKLRGNANALNRSAQRHTATLEKQRQDAVAADDTAVRTKAPASPKPAQNIAPQDAAQPPAASKPEPEPCSDQERKHLWANAMTDVAAECSRNLHKLPPEQRQAEIVRIGAVNETARRLIQENRSDASRTRQHALQQRVLQDQAMVQRPNNMQSDHAQQHPGHKDMNIAQIHSPR